MKNSRNQEALRLVERHVVYAMGAGFIPLPLVDLATMAAIQVRLVREMSRFYNVPDANESRSRSIIRTLFKSIGVTSFAAGGLGSLAKMIPGLGLLVGAATMPVLAGALTYATGITFMRHFAEGGTLTDFDIKTQARMFRRSLIEGKQVVHELQKKKIPAVECKKPDPFSDIPIYTIFKPKLGKAGKVYLKTYLDGKRPEKYLATMDALREKYAVDDLRTVSDRIIEDHRDQFIAHLRLKG